MDDDEIGDFLTLHGYDLLLLTGHTPLHDGASNAWSEEDTDWLVEKTQEPGFMKWARDILKNRPPV